jgi:hypothetical protein
MRCETHSDVLSAASVAVLTIDECSLHGLEHVAEVLLLR